MYSNPGRFSHNTSRKYNLVRRSISSHVYYRFLQQVTEITALKNRFVYIRLRVFIISCAGRNSFNRNHLKTFIISGLFLGLVTTDLDVLFTMVYLLPNGVGGHIVSDGLEDPLHARLEALLGQ
jgi:hypothetical protein